MTTMRASELRRRLDRQHTVRKLAVVGALVLAPHIGWAQAVTDVNPAGNPAEPRFGGRCLGLSVSPSNANNVWVASERGGFFSSPNGGTNWTHIDAIPVPLGQDVLVDPQNANIVIASGAYDLRTVNQG